MGSRIRRRKKINRIKYEQRLELAKQYLHGKTIKQLMYDFDVSEFTARRAIDEFIAWKMVWIGPSFQEEMTF